MSKMIFQKYKQHAVILGSNDDSEVIYIPEKTDDGLPITEIATAAFRDRYHLRCVVLPSTIHTVGQSAFENCWSLTSIGVGEPGDGNIPTHSVLTVSRIEDSAFKNTGLQDITFCNRNVSIGGHAFAFCRDIKGVVFHNCLGTFDGEAAFMHSGIQFLYMPEGEIACLPMETFAQCERLERVVFKTLTGIGCDGFSDCCSLKDLTLLDGINPIYVQRGALQECKKLLSGGKLLRTAYDALVAMGDDIFEVVHKFEREHKDFSSVNAIICRHRIERMMEDLSQDSYLNYRDTILISYLGVEYQDDTSWEYRYRFSLYDQSEISSEFQYIKDWSGRIPIWELNSLDVIKLALHKERPAAQQWKWSDTNRIFLSEIAGAFETDPKEIALELLYRYLSFVMGYIPVDQEMHVHTPYQFGGSFYTVEECIIDERKIHWLRYDRLSNCIPRYRELWKLYNSLKIKEE